MLFYIYSAEQDSNLNVLHASNPSIFLSQSHLSTEKTIYLHKKPTLLPQGKFGVEEIEMKPKNIKGFSLLPTLPELKKFFSQFFLQMLEGSPISMGVAYDGLGYKPIPPPPKS